MLLWAATLAVLMTGCKGFFDDVKENWSDLINQPDPLQVVKTTDRGDRRAEYLARLREPAQNGGTPAQQDEVVNLLIKTATEDPASHCRLQAISSLGRFKDSRVVPALEQAFYNSSVFPGEVGTILRQQTLKALGETGQPQASQLLIRVAQASAEEKDSVDRQQTLDERLAAVRALANFPQPEVAHTLVKLLRTEKDVAMRHRSYSALKTVTGKRLPPDPEAWEQWMASVSDQAIVSNQPPGIIQRVTGFVSGQ